MAMVLEKMEKAQYRKSKSASGIEGIRQIQKHKAVSRLSSDSCSNTDGSTKGHMFTRDEEMFKETEFKRRSPRVNSGLMVHEELSSLWNVHIKQKKLSDSHQQKNVSINIQNNRQRYGGRSSRRSSTKQQEFKDVHEDLEASSHFVNGRRSSRWSPSSMLTKSEMKFYGKRLPADETTSEKLRDLKELDDVLDIPKEWTSKRYSTGKHGIVSHPKCDGAHTSRKSSKVQLEEMNEKNAHPTRIVVVRPNLGNMQNVGMSSSSPYHSHGYVPNFRKMKEKSSIGDAGKISWRRKDSAYNTGFSKPVSTEARKIAREITRRMRDGFDGAVDAKNSWFRRYAEDKNTRDAHRSDFGSESAIFKLPPRNSSNDDNKHSMHPCSSSVELSVNNEAKKRLLERWKMTRRYQELEIVGKSSTLGEMLSIPDGETCPLGIKSRDGLKDKVHKISSRSRSVPPSIGRSIHRRGTYHDILAKEKHLMHRNKVAKEDLSHKELFSSYQDSKSRRKKPIPCQHLYIDEIDSSLEANFEIQMEPKVKDLSEQHLMLQMDGKDNNGIRPVMISQHGQSSVVDGNDKAASHDQRDCCLEELHKGRHKEVELESSKEADHASPVSILEVPSMEDASSSSESFEKVSAALNDLRMQLQLLKMESGTYDDISALDPVEEDAAQLSSILSKGNYRLRPKGWEVSYALDVLVHCGLQDFGFDIFNFRIMWHSPDCPLDPMLFDNLEKNYSDEMSELRRERRLLFDRINSALLEIFQQQVDLDPWMMPKSSGLHSMWQKERVKDDPEKLINQESANGQVTERLFDREMLSRDYRGEIELIGNEIEKLLIAEMIIEFLCD